MFANCRAITGPTLRCMFVHCVQNCSLRFRLPSYNRHMGCATNSSIERSVGLETSAGCLASGGHHLWVPCVQCFSGLGSRHSPSFSSCPSPSCGTCGGGRSPIRCGVVMVEKQEGRSSPGNQRRELCHPFWGWPWKSPHGYYRPHHCWACHPRLQWTSWRQVRGTPSCGHARLRRIQRPASDTSRIHSWHCNAL